MPVAREVIELHVVDRQFRRALDTDEAKLDRFGKTIGRTNERLRDSEGRFVGAGQAADAFGEKAKRAGRRAGGVAGTLEGIGKKAKQWIAGVAVGAVVALGLALFRAFKGATDLEAEMTGVAKTTSLSSRALVQLRDDLVRVSRSTGIATGNLTGYAETAGQLGITGSANILAFVEAAAKLEAVSDLSADDAATSLAKISNAFKLPIENANALGSLLNELSNTTPATARDVADGLTRIGGAGEAIGVTVDEAAGLQATLVGAGVESERAGTALRNLFVRVQTESEAVAAVMKTTTADWSARLERDGMGAVMDLLAELEKMPQAARAATIEDVFGAESFLQVSTLAQGLDTLRANLGTASAAFAEGTSLDREFATSLQNVQAQVGLLWNKVTTFVTGIGTGFLPGVGRAVTAVNRWFASVEELGREYDTLRGKMDQEAEVQRALDSYDRLAQKTDKTEGETEEFGNALDTVQRLRPAYVAAMDANGRATDVFAGSLRAASEAATALYRAQRMAALGDIVQRYADGRDRYVSGTRTNRGVNERRDRDQRRERELLDALNGGGLGHFERGGANRELREVRQRLALSAPTVDQAALGAAQGRADAASAVESLVELIRTNVAVGEDLDEAVENVARAARLGGNALSDRDLAYLRRRASAAAGPGAPTPPAVDPGPPTYTPTAAAPAKAPSASELRRLENEAEAERKRAEAQEASARAYAADMARRRELVHAMGRAERAALEDAQRAEQDAARVRAQLGEERARLSTDEVADAEAVATALDAQGTAARALHGRLEAVRESFETVDAMGTVVAMEGDLIGAAEAADKLRGALADVELPASTASTRSAVDDLREMVGLADDLAGAFEDMGAVVLADLARSVGDVVSAVEGVGRARAFQASREGAGLAGTLAGLSSTVGVVGAAVGVFQGVAGYFQARDAAEKAQREAIAKNTLAVDANTRRFLEDGQVGGGLDGAALDALRGLLADLGPGADRDGRGLRRSPTRFASRLDELASLGVEVSAIRDLALSGDLAGAIRELEDRFGGLATTLGTYGDRIGGKLAEFEDAVAFLGLEGAAAFEELVRLVRASTDDLGDLNDVIAAAETGDAAAAVAAAFEAIRAGSFDFGTLSPDEAEDVLRRILQTGGADGGPTSAQASSVSQITAVQANALMGYAQESLRDGRAFASTAEAQRAEANRHLAGILASVAAATAPPVPAAAAAAVTNTTAGARVALNVYVQQGEDVRAAILRTLPELDRRLAQMAREPDTTGYRG